MATPNSAGTVTVAVKPDTSRFGTDLKSGITGVGEGIGSHLGKTIMSGLGLIGIASAIGGAVKTGFGELMDASAGTAQLAAGIKSTGNAANVTVDGLNNLASSIQGYSGQTDDSIVASEKLLLTFTNIKNSTGAGNDIFNQATKATADLAAKMGGDASGAAIQMGKALNDPVKGITALTRVGVSFDDQQKATIKSMVAHNDVLGAQKIILGELNKEFGGSAAAYGQSLPGMIDRMKRSWEDLTQTLAQTLLPIINPILEGLLALFQKVQPYVQAFANNMQSFFSKMSAGGLSFQGIIKSLTDGVTNFVSGGGLTKMISGFVSLREKVINALLDILPTVISQLANAVVKLLPELVKTLMAMVPQLLETAQKLFTTLITALGTIVPNLLDSIVAMLPKMVNSVISMLPGLIDGALKLFTGLIQGLITVIPKLLTSLIDALPKILSTLIGMLPALITGAMKLFTGLVTGLMDATPQLLKAVMGLIPEIVKTLIELMPQIIDAGLQIVQGLVKGLIDNAPKLIGSAVKTLGSLVVDGFKGLLGIHSPSQVFHDFGVNIGEGLANGIDASTSRAVSSVVKLGKAVTTSFSDGTGITINPDGSSSTGAGWVGPSQSLVMPTVGGGTIDIAKLTNDYNAQWKAIQAASNGHMLMSQAMALADKANGGSLQDRMDQALGNVTFSAKGGPSITMANDASNANLATAYQNAGFTQTGGTTLIYNAAPNDSISAEQKLIDAVQRAKVLGAIN